MDSRCAVCSTGFGNSSMRSLGFDHSSIGHFMALLRPTLNLACTSTCLQCGLQFGGRMRAHRMSKLGFLPRGAGCALAPVKPCQTLPPRGGDRSVRDPSREPRPRSGRPSVWHDGARVAALPMHALGRGPGRNRARAGRCVLGPRDSELTLGGCRVRPWPRAPGGCKGRPWLRAARSGEVFCTGGSSPGKISARRSPRVRSAVRYDDVDGSRLLSHACGLDRSQSCRSSLVLANASPCSDRASSRAPSPIACASSACHF